MKSKIKFIASLLALLLSALMADSFGQIPYVYSVENSGAGIDRPATTMPTVANCPVIVPLPDPFAWSTDPLGVNPARSTSFSDWQKHRQEILDMIQNYEIGTKPAVTPEQITASFSDNTLTVVVTVGEQSLTLTSTVAIPSGATGTFPIVIGMNSPYGSMPAASFSGRGIAAMSFVHNQVSTYGSPANSDPFFRLYPAQNVDNTGQYAAWSWGVSRLIDGLFQLNGILGSNTIDLEHIAVTGCSYAGKMALFAGALDERIALTIAQESGGGGATSWRYSATQEGVEGLAQTDSKWFKNSMFDFGNANVWKIPTDHHMLNALVAPRALLVTGNTDYEWLSNKSNYVNSKATRQIYNTLGISDRFGYIIDGGHNHCAYPEAEVERLGYFLDKFMKSQTDLSENIEVSPAGYAAIEHEKWYEWWGAGVPTPPIDIPEPTAFEENMILYIFKLPTLPTVDGDILNDPAWADLAWMDVDKNKAITDGTSDASAQFKIGYSNDSLYIAVQIIDPTPHFETGLSSYLRDCNELFISMDTITQTVITGGSNQYRITRGGAYDASTVGGKHIVISDDNGWTVEWSIPWAGIAERESFPYTTIDEKPYSYIRFELHVADNTTGTTAGRTQQLFWNAATDDQYNSMTNLGYVKLMGDTPPAINGNTVLDIYKLSVAPAIDGDVTDDAWADTPWTDAYKNKVLTDGSATFSSSSQFKAGFTSDSLYIALKILDSTPHNEPAVSTWLRDCNELFINMDTTTRTGTNGNNQYRLQRDNSALEIATVPGSVRAVAIPVFAADGTTDIGWTAEWALSWSKIAAKESFPYTAIDAKSYPYVRFEFVGVDNTTGTSAGRTQQMFWNAATDDQYGGMRNMGYLRLNGLNSSAPITENSTVHAYYNGTKDALIISGYVGEVKIFDVLGKLVLKTGVTDSDTGNINLNAVVKGVYIVSGADFSTKFIK